MGTITELTAQAAREGFTHGTWQGRVHTLADINRILDGHDISGYACSWQGWGAHVNSLATTRTEAPSEAEVEIAGGVGTVQITGTTTGTTWTLTPYIRFDLEHHPNADPHAAQARIAEVRDDLPDTLDRDAYERLCVTHNVDPLPDDVIVRRGRSTMTFDHSADPTGRRRIGTLLHDRRHAGINPPEADHSDRIAVLDRPGRGRLNSQDRVAEFLGQPTPTVATLAGDCHYCGLPLRNGECQECV